MSNQNLRNSQSMRTNKDAKKLAGDVQMFRIRVATAESKLKLLREQARQAKRRRKEAKRLAQQARKQLKRFKADLTELKQSLAKAEAKLFEAGGRALAGKTAKAKAAAKPGARPSKTSMTAARKPRPDAPLSPRVQRRVARKKPAIAETNVVSDLQADVAGLDQAPSTPQIPGPNS